MKNILYTQNQSATQANSIIVDGDIFIGINNKIAFDALSFINKKSELKTSYAKLIDGLKKRKVIVSHNFKFIIDSSGIFIKSCFNEKDELGRNMPFLFYTNETNIPSAVNILKDYASKLNRSCIESELKTLISIYKFRKNVFVSICVIICICIIICFVLFIIALQNGKYTEISK